MKSLQDRGERAARPACKPVAKASTTCKSGSFGGVSSGAVSVSVD
jgi:hypothetical protein